MRLSSVASVKRLANQWIDLSEEKRKERLASLDTDSRVAVIEELVRLRVERSRTNQ